MNVFENIPFNEDSFGRRKLIDEKHLLVIQIALKPEQIVPHHNANSNVNLLVLAGTIKVNLAGVMNTIKKGDILPVAFKTPMEISNIGKEDAIFLVLKTPNPSEMN